MTPEEAITLLIDFLPIAKRNLDATSAKHLAEVAKIAHDINKFTLRDECLLRVNAIVAGLTVAP